MSKSADSQQDAFLVHADAIAASGILGKNSRLALLFDFLVQHREEPNPTGQVLAREVFDNQEGVSPDDSTVRVYIHRLRQKLEMFYLTEGHNLTGKLYIPKGTYALTFENIHPEKLRHHSGWFVMLEALCRSRRVLIALCFILFIALVVSLFPRWQEKESLAYPPANSLWQDFLNDPRPVVILLGNYFLVGQYAQTPSGAYLQRYVRDFRINSPEDLEIWSSRSPGQFADIENIAMSYLPVSTGVALGQIVPLLAASGKPFSIKNITDTSAEILKENNIIYVGLISGMKFTEPLIFSHSDYVPGLDYDEITDIRNRQIYRTDEPAGRTSGSVYTDYAFVGYQSVGESKLLAIAGLRDTGLLGAADVITSANTSAFNEVHDEYSFTGYLFRIPGMNHSPIKEAEIVGKTHSKYGEFEK